MLVHTPFKSLLPRIEEGFSHNSQVSYAVAYCIRPGQRCKCGSLMNQGAVNLLAQDAA